MKYIHYRNQSFDLPGSVKQNPFPKKALDKIQMKSNKNSPKSNRTFVLRRYKNSKIETVEKGNHKDLFSLNYQNLSANPIDVLQLPQQPNYPQLRMIASNDTPLQSTQDVKQIQIYYNAGHENFKQHKYQKAIDSFADSLVIDPFFVPSRYMLGISYFQLSEYEKSLRELNLVLSQAPSYQKNLFIMLALIYKKKNQLEKAIQILNQGIETFINYYDGLVFKGRLEMKLKDSSCVQSLQKAVEMYPERSQAYICLGDWYRQQKQYEQSIKNFKQAIKIEVEQYQNNNRVNIHILKLAIVLYENEDYVECHSYLNQILQNDQANSEAYNLKGLVFIKEKRVNDALLQFEQSIKHNNSKSAVTQSLIEITKLYIEKRDFYAAYHNLTRKDYLDADQEQIQQYVVFTEAVLYLLKRKFSESQELLKFFDLPTKQIPNIIDSILPAYRTYCFFSLGQHQEALTYCKIALKDKKLLINDRNALMYNQLICEGILEQDLEKAVSLFDQAQQQVQQKPEPEMYKAISWIKLGVIQEPQRQKYFLRALSSLTLASSFNNSLATPFYLRSLLNAYNMSYGQALQDIEQAIDKSDDNIPVYYYLKGVIQGCYGNLQSAIQQFGVCISLQENYSDAYLYRAKCNYLIKDVGSAFDDMEKYIEFKESNTSPEKNVHLIAGHLLLCNKAYEDAYKAYSQSSDQNVVIRNNKCKCLIALKDLKMAYDEMENEVDRRSAYVLGQLFKVQGIYEEGQMNFDLMIDEFSNLLKNKKNGVIFKQHDIYMYRGVCLFMDKKFEQAINDFERVMVIMPHKDDREDEEEIVQNIDLKFQCQYNIILCMIMQKKLKLAYKNVEQMNNIVPELKLLLENELMKQNTSFYLNSGNIIPQNEIISLNRNKEDIWYKLSPIIAVSLEHKYNLYLSIDYPEIDEPNLYPTFDMDLLRQINYNSIENKAEAPWIKKSNEGVIFTDDVQQCDDLKLESENEESVGQKESIGGLQLDEDISEKLNRIINKQKEK